jgi:hypothetical protein
LTVDREERHSSVEVSGSTHLVDNDDDYLKDNHDDCLDVRHKSAPIEPSACALMSRSADSRALTLGVQSWQTLRQRVLISYTAATHLQPLV